MALYTGYNSLLALFGTTTTQSNMNKLIKYAVESSYFFHLDLATQVFNSLKTNISNQQGITKPINSSNYNATFYDKLLQNQISNLNPSFKPFFNGNVNLVQHLKDINELNALTHKKVKNSSKINAIQGNINQVKNIFGKSYQQLLDLYDQIKVYARKSTDSSIQDDITNLNPKKIRIFKPDDIIVTIDKDGNAAVRNLIKSKTGYIVSGGNVNSHFFFFKISHIWGEAFNPWYFKSLWNIVIVPAWVNDLLDKVKSTDVLCQQIIATYKAICYKYYKLGTLLNGTPVLSNIGSPLQDPNVIPGTYNIQVISQSPNATSYGNIIPTSVTI